MEGGVPSLRQRQARLTRGLEMENTRDTTQYQIQSLRGGINTGYWIERDVKYNGKPWSAKS